MSTPQTEIDHEQRLLDQHRTNLRHLRQQQVTYGDGEARLNLLNQIEYEQAEIRQAKTRLRRLGQTPAPAVGDPPETLVPFASRFLTEYPEPIAQACVQFNHAANEREQFIALDRLLVHLTKYLAAIFIGQARLDRLPAYPLPASLDWMAYPVLEHWTSALGQLSQLYRQPAQQAQWRLPELFTACTRPLLDRAELIDVIDFLTRRLDRQGLDEPSVIDLLQLFARQRDQEWQDAPGDYDRAAMEPLLLRLQPALITLLNDLEALRRYPLLYVEWAEATATELRLHTVKFMGQEAEKVPPVYKPPVTMPMADAGVIKARRLYVGNAAGPCLPLHPFFIIQRWDSYVLDHHQPTQFIEFRACRGGRRFRPPPEAKSFHSLWAQGEQPPAPPSDVPPILGQENAVPSSVEPAPSTQAGEPFPLTWFNDEGRVAVTLALGEALRIGRFWLGVEFLLMGLSRQTGALFPRLLQEIGIDPGELRGALRGLVGVVSERNWRQADVAALGTAALPLLRLADPPALRQPIAEEQPPVYTPRLQSLLAAAQQLAGATQIGHAALLWATLQQSEAIPIQLLFSAAAERGWPPKQVMARLAEYLAVEPAQWDQLTNAPASPASPPRPLPPDQRVGQPAQGQELGLTLYGRDLTAAAQAGKLHPVLGESAHQALVQLGRILLQREANNPLLIGDPGVGKSALVEGFAWRLAGGGNEVISQLAGRRVIELAVNSLTAGTKYRGELEGRIQLLLATVKAAEGQIVVFIDEIHSLLSGNSTDGLADAIKPALARGEFPCIGATTVSEYRRHIEKDPALARRFTPIWLTEPTVEEALAIVTQVANGPLAAHHGVTFAPAAIAAAVHLADRYIPDERLPGKAIKLLDQAASGLLIGGSLSGLSDEPSVIGNTVTVDAILAVVAARTNIPVSQLGQTDKQRLLDLEGRLKQRIIGQDAAVDQVVRLVRRAGAGLTDPRRPQGVFLLAGPTGVGKTELALALAHALFDQEAGICRLDMSEFMEKHQVARLTGAPPGYVGHDEEGQLTGRLRRQPYSVVLLDEMEKAHPDVQHLFLQLFDSGRLTDAQGRLADGRRAIFIMTTNLGAKEAMSFVTAGKSYEEKLLAAIHDYFTPEFINRIDRIICFTPLDQTALLAIFDREFGLIQRRLQQEKEITLKLPDEVKAQLVQQVAAQKLGARPLRRLIEDQILAPVVDQLLAADVAPGSAITINLGPDKAAMPLVPQLALPPVALAGFQPQRNPRVVPPTRPASPAAGLPHLDDKDAALQQRFDDCYLALADLLFAQGIALEMDPFAKRYFFPPLVQSLPVDQGLSIEALFDQLLTEPLTAKLLAEEFKAGDWIRIEMFHTNVLFKKMGTAI